MNGRDLIDLLQYSTREDLLETLDDRQLLRLEQLLLRWRHLAAMAFDERHLEPLHYCVQADREQGLRLVDRLQNCEILPQKVFCRLIRYLRSGDRIGARMDAETLAKLEKDYGQLLRAGGK